MRVEPPSGLGQHDVAMFEIDKAYLYRILSQIMVRSSNLTFMIDFSSSMIFNCIDHSGLKENSFNAMETCERANGPGIPVERIGIGRNRPPRFPSDSDLSDGESTPRRRDVDVFHLAPCEAFLSAKESVDEIPDTIIDIELAELYEGTSLSLLSLSLSNNPTTTNHTKNSHETSTKSRGICVCSGNLPMRREHKGSRGVEIHFHPSQKIVYLVHHHYRIVTYPILK